MCRYRLQMQAASCRLRAIWYGCFCERVRYFEAGLLLYLKIKIAQPEANTVLCPPGRRDC